MTLASRSTTATRTPRVLRLAIRRAYRDELSDARRVATLLETVAGSAPQPIRTAKLSKTLRR
jgi:hypothetical protein